MAAVVNERDLILQGAASRLVDISLPSNVVIPQARALTLSAPAYTFRVSSENEPDPSAIVITAQLQNIVGTPTVTWSVTVGTATLTGTGYTRTLTYSNMASDFVTVRAEVDVDGLIYHATTSFYKMYDGVIGVDGRRGSLAVARAITGSVWSDSEALQALIAAGAPSAIAADTCTLFNVSANFSEMRRYNGTSWDLVGASMPGSVLMKGSITTEKLLVTGLGLALNPDPNTQDISAWTGSGVSIVSDTTSPAGSTVLRCTGTGATVLSLPFPIDPTRDYRLRLWGKQQSGTSTCYLAAAFYDASGALIQGTGNAAGWPGAGTHHYYGRLNQAIPTDWTPYSVDFGPNEAAKIPAAARSVRVGVLSHFTGSGEHRFAGVLCHLKTSGEMVVDGTITASKIDSRGLSIKDAAGNVILAAGTALDWGMIGGAGKPDDGATRNFFKGDWATGVTYDVGDIVLDASGYSWHCIQAHISTTLVKPPVYPDRTNAYWAMYGAPGADGLNGTRTAVLEVYRWSDAAPTTFPAGTSNYDWATGQFTPPANLNSWSIAPPAAVAGQTLWVLRQTYADNLGTAETTVTWSASTPVPAGAAGSNGTRVGYLEVYQWAASAPTTFPAGTSTYTWATGAFTAPTTPNGWSLVPGAAVTGQTLWACAVRVSNTSTTTTTSVTWNTTTAFAVGASGTNGLNGADAKAAFVSATSQVFQVNKSGVASPTSVTLTASGQNVTGSPTFTVTSGTATLTGTGNTRALDYSGMTTDTATITVTWDGITDAVTIVKVREGADGVVGSNGTNGITVVVSNEAHTLPASTTGTVSSYTGSGTTIQVFEGSTALTASASATTSAFRVGTITQSPASTLTPGAVSYAGTTATVAQHSAMVAGTDSVVLTLPITVYRADGSTVSVTKAQTLTKSKTGAAGSPGADGANGANAVVAIVSNEAHVFPASSTGTVSSYAGSGTQIRVYEGTTELDYDGVGTANGKWTVSSAVTNITRGSLTDSGTFLTVGDHSGVAAGTDTATIVYTVSGKTAAGVGFTIVKQQSFTKSKAGAAGATGADGPAGPAVVVTADRALSFTATDGTLDASQTNIVLTADVRGLTGPTYAWTFSGFQTAPTASTTHTQTITQAQFGTAKSAVATCTVNGVYKDQVTIVRLEKSTAEAGATVGATIGTNLSGQITSANVSTYIANAAIGSAQIGSIALVGTSNFSVKTAATGARMEMDSRAIKVFDASGVKRVQLGDLTV